MSAHRIEVVRPELRRDAQPRLAHEGGREGERQPVGVEAREHDLAARGKARDQGVEDRRVAADVADAAVVAARIVLLGGGDLVALRPRPCGRDWSPRPPVARPPAGARRASSRPSTPWPTIRSGRRRAGRGNRVLRGRGQRQQHRRARPAGSRSRPRARRGPRAATRRRRTGRARRRSSWRPARTPSRRSDARWRRGAATMRPTDLVARDQRIAHAGKRRHPALPQQPLGAGADAAPGDVHDDVGVSPAAVSGRRLTGEALRPVQHDGERFHPRHPCPP